MADTVSKSLPIGAKSSVIVAEQLGTLRVVMSDEAGSGHVVAYVSVGGLDGPPTHECSTPDIAGRHACIASGIRTLRLSRGGLPERSSPAEHNVLVLEENQDGSTVDLCFVCAPLQRGVASLPDATRLSVLSVDVRCWCQSEDADEHMGCAKGGRLRRLIGLRRAEGIRVMAVD